MSKNTAYYSQKLPFANSLGALKPLPDNPFSQNFLMLCRLLPYDNPYVFVH